MTEAHVSIPTFRGRIGRTLAESEPRFAERPHPGEDEFVHQARLHRKVDAPP